MKKVRVAFDKKENLENLADMLMADNNNNNIYNDQYSQN